MWHCWDLVVAGDHYGSYAASSINYPQHCQAAQVHSEYLLIFRYTWLGSFTNEVSHKENQVSEVRKLERKQLKWLTMDLNFKEKEVKLEVLFNKEEVGRSIFWWGWWGQRKGEMRETEQAGWLQKWFMN